MTSNRKTSNRRRTQRKAISAALVFVIGSAGLSPVFAQSCPQPLTEARRLVLVVSENMAARTATARLFERGSSLEAWRSAASPEPVMLGRIGMAWGIGFQHM